MTLPKLLEAIVERHHEYQTECTTCGTEIEGSDIAKTSLTWGFHDGSGTIRILYDPRKGHTILGSRGRSLDPQTIPKFTKTDDEFEIKPLTEEEVFCHFDRYFSLKKELVKTISDVWTSHRYQEIQLTPNCIVSISRDENRPVQVDSRKKWEHLTLLDSQNINLITQPHGRAIAGRAETWLGPSIWKRVVSNEIHLNFTVNLDSIATTLQHTLELGRISYSEVEDGLSEVKAPNGEELYCSKKKEVKPEYLRYNEIAKRAIYTGIAPETAARLTAEEIIANFLRIDRTAAPGLLELP